MGGRVPRRSATVYAAVARLSARHSTGFYLHCALQAIRALLAPLRQEAARLSRLPYRLLTWYMSAHFAPQMPKSHLRYDMPPCIYRHST